MPAPTSSALHQKNNAAQAAVAGAAPRKEA